MDYERVYVDFIADRRSREAGLVGYRERHHILPRSLGGGDEPRNIISLTAEDHIFAHLLLARIHGGRQWAPLIVMFRPAKQLGVRSRGRRARRIAALARRKNGEQQIGKPRPDVSAKLKGRVFSAETREKLSKAAAGRVDSPTTRAKRSAASTGRVFSAERNAKVAAAKIGAANPARRQEVRAIISEKARGRYAGSANPRFDATVRTFVHVDGRVERLTKYEMAQKHGLNRTCLNYVINGERNATKGWSVSP